ncbi:hypothetical protein BGZ60DRAFT_367092 [Tricladium varicosporioides]|nr:hypothetical protein BGZ60DRAFT_367092 [Hymenoscyphus varicosporioides]
MTEEHKGQLEKKPQENPEKPSEKPQEKQHNTPTTNSTSETFYGLPELCNKTKWTEGLWLHCHNGCGENKLSMCGGLNNARNRVQTCLRLAIDAGSGIIMTPVANRAEEQLSNTNGKTFCPENFWDMEYLKSTMKEHCPQLQVRMCDDKAGIQMTVNGKNREFNSDSYVPGTFHEYVKNTLTTVNITFSDIKPTNQVLIEFGDAFMGWNQKTSNEMPTIRKALFKSLPFNKDLLTLSTDVLHSPELQNKPFVGVHLRGEGDWPGGFGTADDQRRVYAEEIEEIQAKSPQPVKDVYVSCGDQAAIQKFREMMAPKNYTIHDKWSLLASQPSKLAQVEALTFDQRAIIEYQVLVNANYFMGIMTSTLSALIAYARTVDMHEDYFETYVFPGSVKKNRLDREYEQNLVLKGISETKMLVINAPEFMDFFP